MYLQTYKMENTWKEDCTTLANHDKKTYFLNPAIPQTFRKESVEVSITRCSIQNHYKKNERLKQNIQTVNPVVPFPKVIPDKDSIKLLDTIVGEASYGSETNLIVCGKLKLYLHRSSLSLG